ncbi:DNA repair protein RadA [Synechococcus sp. RSCCF101]|uniref:DNA repair protein RadA n=1 Tax=Synechococcus sp. RSCCF101 TaxID=2511069 RepID=UPI0012485F8F|nr:DNA repair protein RadA [Synechococcus sp. RSCCF101]QEY32892.1 DNA repair protein RadA [Synechococcus sp. RSCCF101]
MPRPVTVYSCRECGAQARQFFGRCPSCGAWNSLVEERSGPRGQPAASGPAAEPRPRHSEAINLVAGPPLSRLSSGSSEFDRVLGGGVVPGSLVLVGGDPGIGKSTLLLQSATAMAAGHPVLYVSAEESAQQVRLRWRRLMERPADERPAGDGGPDPDAAGDRLRLLAETDLDRVLEELQSLRPSVAIIDSIQALCDEALSSAPGSVAQVRECASALQRLAKRQGTALLLVGHVTKDGVLAGPKVLEHLVDAVLTFEGDRFASHRLLRAVKNRYGATHELGVFEMRSGGLEEVSNPSELFLSDDSAACGVATIVACEGTRPLVVELQALVNTTAYASPRRTATGIGTNRLHQILAVLERHLGLPLSRYDCYLAVAAGLAVEEPASDLGVAAAVLASCRTFTLPAGTVLIGELGLGGQIRPVSQLELRLQEAARLGFRRAIIPRAGTATAISSVDGLACLPVRTLAEAMVAALEVEASDLAPAPADWDQK